MLTPPRMLTAIDFDDQTSIEADKIDDVTAHRDLPTEFQAGTLPIPQSAPKTTLGMGLMTSQMAGAASGMIFVSPLTLPHAFGVRAPPSPTRGEGFTRHHSQLIEDSRPVHGKTPWRYQRGGVAGS